MPFHDSWKDRVARVSRPRRNARPQVSPIAFPLQSRSDPGGVGRPAPERRFLQHWSGDPRPARRFSTNCETRFRGDRCSMISRCPAASFGWESGKTAADVFAVLLKIPIQAVRGLRNRPQYSGRIGRDFTRVLGCVISGDSRFDKRVTNRKRSASSAVSLRQLSMRSTAAAMPR